MERKNILYSAMHRPRGRHTLAHKDYIPAGIGTKADQHRLQGSRHSNLQTDKSRKTGKDRQRPSLKLLT